MLEPTETRGALSYKALAEKRQRSSMCGWGPVGLERGVGKQAFESQDSCNGSNPCFLEMLWDACAVNFSQCGRIDSKHRSRLDDNQLY